MGLWPLKIFLLLQCGDRLYTSDSDVCRRQILTTKVDPRAVGAKTPFFVMRGIAVSTHITLGFVLKIINGSSVGLASLSCENMKTLFMKTHHIFKVFAVFAHIALK